MSRFLAVCFLLIAMMGALALPSVSNAQVAVGLSIRVGLPALPVYVSQSSPDPGTSGRPVTGLMVSKAATGCPAHG